MGRTYFFIKSLRRMVQFICNFIYNHFLKKIFVKLVINYFSHLVELVICYFSHLVDLVIYSFSHLVELVICSFSHLVDLVIYSFSHLVELVIYTLVIRWFSHKVLFSHVFSHNHFSHFVIVPLQRTKMTGKEALEKGKKIRFSQIFTLTDH